MSLPWGLFWGLGCWGKRAGALVIGKISSYIKDKSALLIPLLVVFSVIAFGMYGRRALVQAGFGYCAWAGDRHRDDPDQQLFASVASQFLPRRTVQPVLFVEDRDQGLYS